MSWWRHRAGRDRPGSGRTVTLVTRQGCHACEEAERVVAAEASRAGAAYVERDVDADPADTELWGHKVPVVLIDGEVHAIWGIDAKQLRAALSS